MSSKFVVEDWIQDNIKIKIPFIELLNNVLLGLLLYMFYSNVEFSIFLRFIKYCVLLLFIRYILSYITTIKDVENNNKRYFQINGHVALFLIIILLCIETNTFGLSTNVYLSMGLILVYSLIVILAKYGYTYDIITTILLVNVIFNSEQLRIWIG
jgi:hypothetical protein